MHFEPFDFQFLLLKWFEAQAREMPWRNTQDPYCIWVSEIMLQQTQVATVKPYFNAFIARFPSVVDLADASEEVVLKHWEGLGYYSRARNLHKGAKYVVEKCKGQVPNDLEGILKVPGIGPYSAGAILSIAFGVSAPAIDGNVYRVTSRLFAYSQDVTKAAPQRQIKGWVTQMIPEKAAGDFNQALMELGALVCSPKKPKCTACPVQSFCLAQAQGIAETLPVKKKKKPPKPLNLLVALIRNSKGEFLIQKQDDKGIFKSLWCFPHCETLHPESEEEQIQAFSSALISHSIEIESSLFEVQHTLTHRQMSLKTYLTEEFTSGSVPEGCVWVDVFDEHAYAMPVAHQKIIWALREQPLFFST